MPGGGTVPRDPYAILAKLRRLDTRAAQGRLAEAQMLLFAQRAAVEAVAAELRRERSGDAPGTYGAFLARMLAARQQQAAALVRAGVALDAERDAVATARTGEKMLAGLRERRAAADRRRLLRREQARLEDALPRG